MRELPAAEFEVPHELWLQDVAFSPDGKTLATCDWHWARQSRVALWDVETRKLRKSGPLPSHAQSGLFAYSREGRFIAYAWEQMLYLLNAASLEPFAQFGPLAKACFISLDFSSDGRFLATGDWNGFARYWDVASRRELDRTPHFDEMVKWVLFLGGDSRMMIGTSRCLYTWDIQSGSIVKRIQIPEKCGRDWRHHTSKDRKTIVSITDRGYLIRHDAATDEPKWERLRTARGRVRCLSPDGAHLAIGRFDGGLLLWDIRNHMRWSKQKTPYYSVESLQFSPDGSRLACLGEALAPDGRSCRRLMVLDTGFEASD